MPKTYWFIKNNKINKHVPTVSKDAEYFRSLIFDHILLFNLYQANCHPEF